ncbi:MAG: LysR family transcriptional regulator [Halioglobus sp.]
MRLDQVDLNLFVVFDALYRERSVTRVAQTLHLTQPAVSNALNRLRRSFDDQLFVRSPRGMQPTPVAEAVSTDVQRALLLLQKSMLSGQRFEPASAETTFRLGMNDMAQNLVLPGVHNTLAQLAPGITVEAYYFDRSSAVEQLKSGDLDLLLDAPQVNARELEQLHLGSLPYKVAMARSHPLAKKNLGLDQYLNATHAHVSARARGRGQVDLALHSIGHRRRVAMRVQHYAVAAAVTAQSDLLWTAPGPVIDHRDLHVADVPFDVNSLVLNLYWHRSAAEDPANAWMREILRQEFANGVSKANYYGA